jgi:hypothetical protein
MIALSLTPLTGDGLKSLTLTIVEVEQAPSIPQRGKLRIDPSSPLAEGIEAST